MRQTSLLQPATQPATRATHLELDLLYRDHHGWLVSWLRRRIGSIHDAGDLAQDTFVHIMRKQLDLACLRTPRAWLATIAHGIMVDHIRRKDLEQAYLQAIAALPEPEVPSPEQRIILLETLTRIDAMLDGLQPKARAAFLLSRLEGLTYPQIATQLGVSLSSVEKYMATAIRHCLTFDCA